MTRAPKSVYYFTPDMLMNVCFSGGGIKGYAFIGVVKYLQEHNVKIKEISGVSIGALISLLVNIG